MSRGNVGFKGGAGGGGGGSDFTTRPDNLRSTDTFEGVLGLCAGPIKGPVNGLQGIKIDTTPIQDVSGSYNFPDFTAIVADGDPLKFPQKPELKLGAASSPINIGLQLTNTNTSSPGPYITKTVTNLNAAFIDLRFVVQQLYKQNEDGIYPTTLNLEIEMKPVGSTTWINPFAPSGVTPPTTAPTTGQPNPLPDGAGGSTIYYNDQNNSNVNVL